MAQALTNTLCPQIPLVNVTNEYITILFGYPIAVGSRYRSHSTLPLFSIRKLYTPTDQDRQRNIHERMTAIGHLIDPERFKINSDLSHEQQEEIRKMLKQHATVFNWSPQDFTKIKT